MLSIPGLIAPNEIQDEMLDSQKAIPTAEANFMNMTQGVAVGILICLPGSGYEQVQRFPLDSPKFSFVLSQGCLGSSELWLPAIHIYLVAMLGVEYLGANVGKYVESFYGL